MYDNVDFGIQSEDVGGLDFLSEVPRFIEISGEHNFDGNMVLSGNIGSMSVSISSNCLKVKNGSLCKWYLGNNFQTMQRADTRLAIEKLSDILHLPMERAGVSRIDVAQNFIVKHPPDVYYNHLGAYDRYKRLEQPDGLYYINSNGILVFYNKTKEQQDKRQPIPDLYKDRNVLRYEQRYKRRLSNTFSIGRVTAACLYDEAFYVGIINRWKEAYSRIKKINEIQLNFEGMRTKKDLYKLGVLSLVEKEGGQLVFLKQIAEAQRRGDITNRQAFDLRGAIDEACKVREGLNIKSEAISELDKKVSEAAKFYR